MSIKKITKATLKSFIKNNPNFLLKVKSEFDGMTDCVQSVKGSFHKNVKAYHPCENNLGIQGLWLVHGSGNRFYDFNEGGLRGIEVYNCCGSFIVAVEA